MSQVPWVQEQLFAHLGGKSKAPRCLFPSLSTLGVTWDKVGCSGEWVRKGRVGGCRTQLSMAGAAWGDLQHLWQGGVNQNRFTCKNYWSQSSVFTQASAFSSPAIHWLHRGAEFRGWGRGPRAGSASSGELQAGAVPKGCVPAWPCQGCRGKWLHSGHFGIPQAGLSITRAADPL